VEPEGHGPNFCHAYRRCGVDSETGKVADSAFTTAVQDAGKAIHPGYVEARCKAEWRKVRVGAE